MTQENREATEGLLRFIEASPTAFHAVEEIAKRLSEAGFCRLNESEEWELDPGGRYFVTRNQSSVIAFALPPEETGARSFLL